MWNAKKGIKSLSIYVKLVKMFTLERNLYLKRSLVARRLLDFYKYLLNWKFFFSAVDRNKQKTCRLNITPT